MAKEKTGHITKDTPHPACGHFLPNAEKESLVARATEPFINKVEVARRLGRTVRTVDNWMQRGWLPYFKIGRSVSFKWSDVESHLAQTCRVCRGSRP